MIKKNNQDHKSKNDSQIIEYIRNITKDLLDQSASPAQASFIRTKQRENNKYIRQDKQQLTKTFHLHSSRKQEQDKSKGSLSRGKRLPIFKNFQDLWQMSKESPQKSRVKVTPIMDRINKNIYSRFKTQSSNRDYLEEKALTAKQKEQLWQNFLSRQQKWSYQRKQDLMKGELKTKLITRRHHSKQAIPFGSVQRRLFCQTNQEKQMSKVQHTIQRLKIQTEDIARKLKDQINPSVKNNSRKGTTAEAKRNVKASSKQRQYPLRKTYA